LKEEDVLSFVQESLPSVWALEVLIAMRRAGPRRWQQEDLVRETRSSTLVVDEALRALLAASLVAQDDGLYCCRPATPVLERLASEVDRLYAAKPMTLIKAILAVPYDKRGPFSGSFRLRE
jgi:hypothetical protein